MLGTLEGLGVSQVARRPFYDKAILSLYLTEASLENTITPLAQQNGSKKMYLE